jgi:Zn-dependent metalloprotease
MNNKTWWMLLFLLILGCSAVYFSPSDNYANQDTLRAPASKTLNTLLRGSTTKFPSSTNAALRLKPVESGAAAELTAEQLDDAHDLVKRLLLVDDPASSSAEKTLPERLQSGLNRLQESASDEIRASFSPQKTLNGLYGRIPVQSVSLDNPESFSIAVERKVADFPDLFMNSGEMDSIGVESSCGKHLCTTVVRRSYKGIEAWDYSLNFVSSDRNIIAVQGEFETPVVSGLAELQMGEQEYLDIVNSYFGLERSAIESGSAFQFGIDRHGAHNYFALKAIVVASNGFRRIVYVSQESKKVIRDSDLVHTEGVEAEGLNLLGEPVQFQAEAVGDVFEMSDTRFPKGAVTDIRDHSATILTKDFLGRTIFSPNPLVSDRDETIVKSNFSDSGWDAAGISALEGTKDLYFYFADTHGFPGDGVLFPVTIFVNGNYSNAVSFGNGKFAYGRGNGSTERNYAIAKDIIAHEVTHGVISAPNMSNLEYSFESGALNESLADFFGAIVGDGNWTMGESIRIDGRPGRSMSSPSSYGDPAHYSDRRRVGIEIDRGGVHSNSGIPNRMFYLLAEGLTAEGIGTSIGREKTAALAFVLIKSLKPTKATFQQAADLMVSAAIDIYDDGVGNSVRDAWKAVGIPDETVTFSSLETGTQEKPTANVLAYLSPNFSISTFGIQNNSYALYLQAYSSELKSFEADLNVGPFNTFQARFTKPILVPKEDGNVVIAYQDTSGIFRIFNSKSGETNALVVDGIEFSAITVSTDSRYVAFSVMDSPNIYILDNETDSASTVTVRMTTNTEGVLGPQAEYVDAIAFDPTGRKIVFDFLTCEDQGKDDCVEEEKKYWSIGVLDVQDLTLDFPFPQQPSTIDVGFPSFSNLNDRHIVFDLIDRDADVESGIISLVTIYDTLENSLQLGGLPDLSSAQLGALGVPSFSADDSGVIHATRFDSGNSLLYFQDIVDYEAVDIEDGRNELNPFLAFMPISVPAVSQDKKPQLVIDQSSLDFGEIIIGSKKGAAACISNAGRFSIEIKGVNTEFDDLSWDGTGVDLDAGRQFCGQFIFDSSDRDVGPLESTISIKHNGSNSPTPVSFKAYFDIDTDEDGTGNNTDTDDDNDKVLDADDAFPLDASEFLDSDGDGIGNNADSDDDNDEVLDADDAFPLDSSESVDTDGDGIGNNADTDDDNDEVLDGSDAFPLDATESVDSDSDGTGNNADTDDDNDGVLDSVDLFPLNASESADTDGDGLGNNADLDDDNDGFSDDQEELDGTNPLNRFSCKSGCFSFDVDESLEAQPLTDGLLVIRHLFGFSGDSLTSGAVSGGASRDSSEAIVSYLTDADSELDIDGDGESKPLTDGLLLIRYLFGFSGDSLISGAIGDGAERDTADEVEAYIGERVPAN